jgi:type II secretory pathway pseudopilin PulG
VSKNFPPHTCLRSRPPASKAGILIWISRCKQRPGWDSLVFACRKAVAGSTLLELAIIITILAIFAGIGIYNAQDSISEYRLMKVSRMFQSDIQNLRATAINTNRQTRLKLVAADSALDPDDVQVGEWLLQVGNRSSRSNEWDTLPIDLHGEGNNSQGERSLSPGGLNEARWISLAPWNTLAGSGIDNQDCIVFSPRGWLENPPSDFVDGYIDVTFVNKHAGGPEQVTLKISRGGLARMVLGEKSALPENEVGVGDASILVSP